jgi:hypothetical protein
LIDLKFSFDQHGIKLGKMTEKKKEEREIMKNCKASDPKAPYRKSSRIRIAPSTNVE